MGIKAALSIPYAHMAAARIRRWSIEPVACQDRVFVQLVKNARNTVFGQAHGFDRIGSYEEFKKRVPLRDYEQFRPYIDRISAGESDVLWPGKPLYLCKTSGTTSGTKYIPISRESIHNHTGTARDALLSYIAETGKSRFVNGKMIFLQGSPELDKTGPVPVGRLSGIVAHHVPAYLQRNRLPSYSTNCIEDWEKKVDAIVEETMRENMTLISGIPPWVQMYFERLRSRTGKSCIAEIFPNFSLFVHGGVNFGPYHSVFERLIGRRTDSIETYPASEGFIAYQDSQHQEGLLLTVNNGIFYEFIPLPEVGKENPERISLRDVETGVNYAIALSTNAGLWGYNIGDTVRFVSKNPWRLVVSGRVKHFTSAFGEHVIAEEVEFAMKEALRVFRAEVTDFHVAPRVNPPEGGLPYHEWFVEFSLMPEDMKAFAGKLDALIQQKNIYYRDLIAGNVLQPLKIRSLKKDAFTDYMRSVGKLGGQNKLPRLANDRFVADKLSPAVR